MSSNEQDRMIERIARSLAESAGVVWDTLDKHPGYLRNRLLQDARSMTRALTGRATPLRS